jgi:hypothetical protein
MSRPAIGGDKAVVIMRRARSNSTPALLSLDADIPQGSVRGR